MKAKTMKGFAADTTPGKHFMFPPLPHKISDLIVLRIDPVLRHQFLASVHRLDGIPEPDPRVGVIPQDYEWYLFVFLSFLVLYHHHY